MSYLEHEGVVVSSVGANITRWREEDKDIFYPFQKVTVGGKVKDRGGMHPCFPNSGREQKELGLPQHGPLRHMKASSYSSGHTATVCNFYRKELTGNFGQGCSVKVNMSRTKNGFVCSLTAQLSRNATKDVPIGAGFHPYFSTPKGIAEVFAGERYKIAGLITDAMIVPFAPGVIIDIPGLGVVEMFSDEAFRNSKTSRLIIWRDREEYLCVEPVLATGGDYAMPDCPVLEPGGTLKIRTGFRLLCWQK